jgi:hypothetical protein
VLLLQILERYVVHGFQLLHVHLQLLHVHGFQLLLVALGLLELASVRLLGRFCRGKLGRCFRVQILLYFL